MEERGNVSSAIKLTSYILSVVFIGNPVDLAASGKDSDLALLLAICTSELTGILFTVYQTTPIGKVSNADGFHCEIQTDPDPQNTFEWYLKSVTQ